MTFMPEIQPTPMSDEKRELMQVMEERLRLARERAIIECAELAEETIEGLAHYEDPAFTVKMAILSLLEPKP